MADISPQTIRGNLTETPTLRFTQRGQSVTNLRVAVNYPADSKGNQRPTDFFNVEVWGPDPDRSNDNSPNLAANVSHLPKGCRVIVVGRLKAETWKDRDGNTHHGFRIVADDVGPSGLFNPVFSGYSSSKPARQQADDDGRLPLPEADTDF